MPRLIRKSHPNVLFASQNRVLNRLLAFASIIFIFSLADSILSYYSPVYINKNTLSPFITGLLISTSSMVGMLADFTMSNRLNNKSFTFFMFAAISGSFIVPLLFFLPFNLIQIVMAMAIWGIYYECKLFSNFHAVHHMVKKEKHAFAWGVITTFQSAAYFIGPTFAIMLLDRGTTHLLSSTIVLQCMALFGLVMFVISRKKHQRTSPNQTIPVSKKSILNELLAWKVLGKRLWPMLFFAFVLSCIDAAFMNIGALLSEEIRHQHPLGAYLIAIYLLPGLLTGLFVGKFNFKMGKKRTAFVFATIAGLFLGLAGIMPSIEIFLLLVFLSSTALSITLPLTLGTFEDYIARLGRDASDLIGLENSFTSLSFVIGPIAAGLIATFVGYKVSFSFFGFFLCFTALVLLLVVPRKIRLPQKELELLD